LSVDEFGKMKKEIPMAVLEARVKKAAEEMEGKEQVEPMQLDNGVDEQSSGADQVTHPSFAILRTYF
jgi:hypothetical protein